MSEPRSAVPRPTPFDELPAIERPAELEAHPPALLRAVQAGASGRLELALIYKRTYTFEPGKACVLSPEQPALLTDPVPHEELEPDEPVSFRALADLVGYKPGTDLVVNGSVRPPRPVAQASVGVSVGDGFQYRADVFGDRVADHVNGRIVFSDAKPFEEIPLRLENAYGGRDPWFERTVMEGVRSTADPEKLRRVTAAAESILGGGNPARYPRNRFGKGWILENRPEAVQGRALPNLEMPDDRLTPDRLIVGHPLEWAKQPLPASFGVLDFSTFPRSAMCGLPPMTTDPPLPYPEVERGLLPPDFCRGNLLTTPPEKLPTLIHPWIGRCASQGLWLPFLWGNEWIALDGMDPAHPRLALQLPGERPWFQVHGMGARPLELESELYLVDIDATDRTVVLIWVGRHPLDVPLEPKRLAAIEADARVGIRGE
ncbi:MAG TPA: DUF2169 domain-containing protein [Longimicrobiales bacterium]|nr:DUF2169 domain-containing protein [Longimicrobiales bacterium]